MKKLTVLIVSFNFLFSAQLYISYGLDMKHDFFGLNYKYNQKGTSLGYSANFYKKNNFGLDLGTEFSLVKTRGKAKLEDPVNEEQMWLYKQENEIYSLYLSANYQIQKKIYCFLKSGVSIINSEISDNISYELIDPEPGDTQPDQVTKHAQAKYQEKGFMAGLGVYYHINKDWGIGYGYSVYSNIWPEQNTSWTKYYYQKSLYIGYNI